MNIDITNPIAPPAKYENPAFPRQFPSSAPKGVDSDLQSDYYMDSLKLIVTPLGL
jgi:hypothetical protein